ncbi:MAG TPA: Gfo/Idh/MocA family oxidoreductase [Bryobacterales bacterium]|nr:Gfo/Idh/MocA family oxidoreductase [Bryobacterales bacterium]
MTTNSRREFLFAGAAAALYPQAPKKVRVAIIGAGHRSWAHIHVLRQAVADVEIVAIADPTPENLDRAVTLAGSHPATYSDYKKMLTEQKDLDAVLVAAPNFLHAEAAIAALDRGLNVLSEKPMATSVEDANRMTEAARRAGKILQIGQQMRYTPLYEKMAAVVKAGAIGPVEFVSGNLFRGDWNPASWRYPNPRTGVATNWRFLTHTAGSSLLEDGIHELDVIHWLVGGRVARVYATGGNNVLKQRETIDHAGILIEYENGAKVDFGFCLFAPNAGPEARAMFLIGSQGTIQQAGGKATLRKKGSREATSIEAADTTPAAVGSRPAGIDEDNGTYREWVAFVSSVRTGKQPIASGQVGKEAIKISLLAEKSIRERRIIDWNELPA